MRERPTRWCSISSNGSRASRGSYAEVIETWRTSCPRLTIWEDAVDRGYVARRPSTEGCASPSPKAARNFCASTGGAATAAYSQAGLSESKTAARQTRCRDRPS